MAAHLPRQPTGPVIPGLRKSEPKAKGVVTRTGSAPPRGASSIPGAQAASAPPAAASTGPAQVADRILGELKSLGLLSPGIDVPSLKDRIAALVVAHTDAIVTAMRVRKAVPQAPLPGSGPAAQAEILQLRNQVAEARARIAAVRSQLSRAELETAQATQRAAAAEEKVKRAEVRAHKAEVRLKEAEEDPLRLRWGGKEVEVLGTTHPGSPSHSHFPDFAVHDGQSRTPSPPPRRGGDGPASPRGHSPGRGPSPVRGPNPRLADAQRRHSEASEETTLADSTPLRRQSTGGAGGTGREEQEARVRQEREALRREREAERRRLEEEKELIRQERDAAKRKQLQEREARRKLEEDRESTKKKHGEEVRSVKEKAERELDRLKNVHREKGDKTAEQMADKFHQKHCHELMQVVLTTWHKGVLQEKVNSSKAKSEEALNQEKARAKEELEKLQNRHREKGDKTAEQMAEKFHAKHCQELLTKVAKAWQLLAVTEKASKAQAEAKKKHEEEQAAAKKKHEEEQAAAKKKHEEEMKRRQDAQREKDEKEKEALAERSFQRVRTERMQGCFKMWQDVTAKEVAERKAKEHEAQMQKQGELREKNMQQTGEKLYKKYCTDLMQAVFIPWKEETIARKHQREQEALLNKHAEDKDRTALQMAEKMYQKQCQDTLEVVVNEWQRYTAAEKATRAAAEAKRKHEEEVERLRQEQTERGDKNAEVVAEKAYQRVMMEIKQVCMNAWQDLAAKAAAEKKRLQHEAELEEMQRQHREKGDATAELLAAKFYKKIQFEMVQQTFIPWQALSKKAAIERKHKQQQEELQKQYLEDKDKAAETMAEKLYRKKMKAVVEKVWSSWLLELVEAKAQRTKEELRRRASEARHKHEHEVEELKRQQIEKGDQHAATVADKWHRRYWEDILREIFHSWHDDTVVELAVRTQEEQRRQHAQELSQLKAQNRARGTRAAEQASERLYKKLCLELLMLCYNTWHNITCHAVAEARRQNEQAEILRKHAEEKARAHERVAEKFHKHKYQEFLMHMWAAWDHERMEAIAHRKQEETRLKHESELAGIAQKRREQKKRHAAVVTERNFKLHCDYLLETTMSAWHAVAIRLSAQRVAEEVLQQHIDEKLVLKRQELAKAEKATDRAAIQVQRRHNEILAQTCLDRWHQEALVERKDRMHLAVNKRLQDELTLNMRKSNEKLNNVARVMFGKFDECTIMVCMERCFANWFYDVKLEVYARAAAGRVQQMDKLFEDDIERLVRAQAMRTETMARRLCFVRIEYDTLLLLQFCMFTWNEEKQDEKHRRAAQALQVQQEDELATLVHAQAIERSRMLDERAVKYMRYMDKVFLLRFVLGWHQTKKFDRMKAFHEMMLAKSSMQLDAVQKKSQRILDTHLQRVGGAISNRHCRAVLAKFLGLWHEEHVHTLTAKARAATHIQHKAALDNLYDTMLEKLSDTAAKLTAELDQVNFESFMHQVVSQWRFIAVELRQMKNYHEALSRQQAAFKDKALRMEQEELQVRGTYISRAAAVLARRVKEMSLGACYRAWREAQVRERYTEAVERFREEVTTLNRKHAAEFEKHNFASLTHKEKVANYGLHLQEHASTFCLTVVVLFVWRVAAMVPPPVHKDLLKKGLEHAYGRGKSRVMKLAGMWLRARDETLMERVVGRWCMVLVDTEHTNEVAKINAAAVDKVSQGKKEVRETFGSRLERLVGWGERDIKWSSLGRMLAMWYATARVWHKDQKLADFKEAEQLRLDEMKSRVDAYKGALVPQMAKIPRRVLLQRYFSAYKCNLLLAKADEQLRHRVGELEAHHEADTLELLKAKRLHGDTTAEYVQRLHVKMHHQDVLACLAAAWHDVATTERERKYQEAQKLAAIKDMKTKDSKSKQLEGTCQRYVEWMYHCGVIIIALRCLHEWRLLKVLDVAEKQITQAKKEADGRLQSVRKKMVADKEVSMERAAKVLSKGSQMAAVQETFQCWVRYHELARLHKQAEAYQKMAQAEVDKLRQEHGEQVFTVKKMLQGRWAAASETLGEHDSRTILMRCVLSWAQVAKVARLAEESRKTVKDYEELVKTTEQRLQEEAAARKRLEATAAEPGPKRAGRGGPAAVAGPAAPLSLAAPLPGSPGFPGAPQLAWVQPAGYPVLGSAQEGGGFSPGAAATPPRMGPAAAPGGDAWTAPLAESPAATAPGVETTLARLAKARSVMAGVQDPAVPPTAAPPKAAPPGGSVLPGPPTLPPAVTRGTIVDQVQLEAQLQKMQQYVSSVQSRIGTG